MYASSVTWIYVISSFCNLYFTHSKYESHEDWPRIAGHVQPRSQSLITASLSIWSLNETLDPTSLFRINFQRSPVSKNAGVYFVWYSKRGTNIPSGVLFCKSFERVFHSSVAFHKYFEHRYLLANQLNSNLYVFWPIKIQMSKVGARVATAGEVLR